MRPRINNHARSSEQAASIGSGDANFLGLADRTKKIIHSMIGYCHHHVRPSVCNDVHCGSLLFVRLSLQTVLF